MFQPTDFKRSAFFVLFDILISLFTLFMAYNLRLNFDIDQRYFINFFNIFIILSTLKIITFSYLHIYQVVWRFFSLKEAKKIVYAHILVYLTFTIIYIVVPEYFNPFPRTVIIIDLFLSILFIGGLRVSKRLMLEDNVNKNLKKTMIIGVNNYAQTLIKQNNDFYIDAIIDETDILSGTYFSNIKVGKLDDIQKISQNQDIKSVIITKIIDKDVLEAIYKKLYEIGIKDILIANLSPNKTELKNLSVEDLLARRPKDLDKEKIQQFITNKTILITGAGGSIGSEISRQCEKYGAKKLILLDHSEFNLYTITEEIKKVETIPVLQNIVDIAFLDNTFKIYKPDIVIHAAAYKHVPLVEYNIDEAIINNVVGTKNVIDTAIKYGAEKFVMISTDKAVRPTNVMGTTKRICELYAQNSNNNKTDIVAVRFGNVLGSSGSVIPKFKSQIQNHQNITVTDPNITRYFMLIPEACELVLQAGAIGTGGEIFILDMGEPIKIVDLAKKMIELSGVDDIDIEFVGLRPGEKLYEELLIDKSNAKTQYESITVAQPTKYDINKLNQDIKELIECDSKLVKLKDIVPEFNHKIN